MEGFFCSKNFLVIHFMRFFFFFFFLNLGKMPSLKLLKRYKLQPFIDVRNAVVHGNLLLLTKALDDHQTFFIKAGIYLILEKLKIITYRNLFKRISLILNTHQLAIEVVFLFFVFFLLHFCFCGIADRLLNFWLLLI